MLRYFRINDPYRLLGLLALLLCIYLPIFINGAGLTVFELKSILIGEKVHEGNIPYSKLIDSTAPITAWFYAFVDIIFGRSLLARHILAFFILFSQSAFLGIMFNSKKAFLENTYIPSLLFSILAFFSFDMLSLSGELLGSGFLLLALNNLLKEIQFRAQRSDNIFNLGLYISLASLCSFSYIIHLLCVCAILAIFTRSSIRSFMLLIFGFALPQLLVMSLYYLNDILPDLWNFYYLPNLTFSSEKLISSSGLLMLGALPLVYLLVSLVMLNRVARFSKYQSQIMQSLFFWMLFSVLQAFYSKDLRPQSFIALIPCLSYFITHLLLFIRRRRFAEMGIWGLLVGVVGIAYLAKNNKISSVNYNQLLVPQPSNASISGKKILVLGDEVAMYQQNKLATPFLSWPLSRDIFEQPGYYENVISVYEGFTNDPPQVIMDPGNLMKSYLDKIPALKKMYKRTGAKTYELVESKK